MTASSAELRSPLGTYSDALAWLFPRITTIKFGLETTRELLDHLGHPERVVPVIHVGGTNGKGSVSHLMAGALFEAGWRVGLYTSPHLTSFRERIRVDGVPISEEAVAMWARRLEPLATQRGATFFETTTAMAFADMAARGAEIVVVEVGLGGRLDSTNVVDPLVSVVTGIAMDHQKYLGDTVEAIAREKAWIAKPGRPFVVGEGDPIVRDVLEAAAREAVAASGGGELEWLPVAPDRRWKGALRLRGPHQRRNAAVAHAALLALPGPYRPSDAAIERAFATVSVPGRLDRRGLWLFDVAHNPDGMASLTHALRAEPVPGPVHALVSILGDKPWPEMLVALDAVIDRGILTVAPTALDRGWNTTWLREWLERTDRPAPRARWSLVPDFQEALQVVREGAGTVLVTGSFHTVGDVLADLGLAEVLDPPLRPM